MIEVLLSIALCLLLAVLCILLVLLLRKPVIDLSPVQQTFQTVQESYERSERTVRDEFSKSRQEIANVETQSRRELNSVLKQFWDSINKRQDALKNTIEQRLQAIQDDTGSKLDSGRQDSAKSAKFLRDEIATSLSTFNELLCTALNSNGDSQKDQLQLFAEQLSSLTNTIEHKFDGLRIAMEAKLTSIQDDNSKRLEQMRQTVDEKLQGTLEKRLGESFKLVSERLELVHQGLGEMQSLASGVGDLKKVLANVKTRGTWGEIQLGAMLEQVLAPEQFAANVSTRNGGERVEFAVKLPGRGDDRDEVVWLPIDAKFPIEDYQRVVEAQEKADPDGLENAGKQLEHRIKSCATDICRKYLNPPHTTDFAILYLPIEGLFAEVIRRIGLAECVQREYRIIIAGPTTLWSLLNSLQVGFRTLAIQKRSSEVWNLLSAVKTEWSKYDAVLDKVRKKLHEASNTVDDAARRTRAIGRKLKNVQELPKTGQDQLLIPLEDGLDEPIEIEQF